MSSAHPESRPQGPGLTAEEIHQEDAITAWADGYCGAVGELVRSISTIPDIDPSTPHRTSRTSSELLGVMVVGLDRTLDRLDGLEPAPLHEAEAVKSQAVATYTGIRDSARSAKQQLDEAADPEARDVAIGSVKVPLDQIGRINLLNGFDAVPELRQAGQRAPACRQLLDWGPEPRFDPGRP